MHAVEDDDGRFVDERRIVAAHVGIGDREQVAVAVLMLKPFAGERGAAGGAAEQKALGPANPAAAQIRSPIRWKPNIE